MRMIIYLIMLMLLTAGLCKAQIQQNPLLRESGPTLELDYGIGCSENPIDHFMYFIQLISPVLVDPQLSINNTQNVRITSFNQDFQKNRFHVLCELEIIGTGYFLNKYDFESMIENCTKNKKVKILKNVIDFIKIQGHGKGWIEVTGKIINGENVIDEIEIKFDENSNDILSIGTYDIKYVGDKYDYANRFNQTVVYVDTLYFKRSNKTPRMEITVSYILKETESIDEKAAGCRGFWIGIKRNLANMFIGAVELDETSYDIMIDFGRALMNQKRQFTFPKAGKLMSDNANCIRP